MPSLNWEATIVVGGLLASAYLVAVWIGLSAWTWRDVSRRTGNPGERLFAVALVVCFGLAGWAVYLLMRPHGTLEEANIDRLQFELLAREMTAPSGCTRCRRRVGDDFVVCPYCREELRTACVRCTRPLDNTWVACAYCGADAPPRAAARTGTPAAASAGAPAYPSPRVATAQPTRVMAR